MVFNKAERIPSEEVQTKWGKWQEPSEEVARYAIHLLHSASAKLTIVCGSCWSDLCFTSQSYVSTCNSRGRHHLTCIPLTNSILGWGSSGLMHGCLLWVLSKRSASGTLEDTLS